LEFPRGAFPYSISVCLFVLWDSLQPFASIGKGREDGVGVSVRYLSELALDILAPVVCMTRRTGRAIDLEVGTSGENLTSCRYVRHPQLVSLRQSRQRLNPVPPDSVSDSPARDMAFLDVESSYASAEKMHTFE
jgi:hypothetical protein